MTTLSPRLEARACRIWGVAKEHDWKITQVAIADALGIDFRTVSAVVIAKGWQDKFDKDEVIAAQERGRCVGTWKKRKDHSVDVNTLDLVELMGGGE